MSGMFMSFGAFGLLDGFAAGLATGFFDDLARDLAGVFAVGFLTAGWGVACSISRRIAVSAMTRA